MSQVSASSFLPVNAGNLSSTNSMDDLGTGDFLDLLIAELQNQDPLNPADNSDLLQQISQIRQITSNDSMISTLESVQSGQEVSTASQLIGKRVTALSTENEDVDGIVDRVTIGAESEDAPRQLLIHVGDHKIKLEHIREIVPVTEAV